MAVNCWVRPAAMEGLAGVTAIETSTGASVTVSVVEPVTEPALALMVVTPTAAGRAIPWLLTSLVMEAIPVEDELHTADCRLCVLPSVNVPVAVSCWLVPRGVVGSVGLTAMETSPAGVKVAGWYSSALASSPLVLL